MEQETKKITELKPIMIYRVNVSEHLTIEGEKSLSEKLNFGIVFAHDRDIYIVGMTAPEIYALIGEEFIISLTKLDYQTFVKKS